MILGIIGIIGITIAGFFSMSVKQKAANDENNSDVLYIDKLIEVSKLHEGEKHLVIIYRQSGNIQQKDKVYPSASSAIKAAASTFKRAKIPFVCITENSNNKLAFRRPWHDHRGNAEGKKVGAAVILPIRN